MNRAVKILFLDIDGTLTTSRDSHELDLDAISAIRRAVRNNIIVSLVSSNTLPIVVGLAYYIGLNSPAIGESGCLIYYVNNIVSLSPKTSREPYLSILKHYGEYVEDVWHNAYRLCDYALRIRKEYREKAWEIVNVLKKYIEVNYQDYVLEYSGYAIHVRPSGVDKGKAVQHVLKTLNIDPSEAAGIGDSVMDASFLELLGFSAAVSNADEELKRRVSMVSTKPSGQGVVEFIEYILVL